MLYSFIAVSIIALIAFITISIISYNTFKPHIKIKKVRRNK